MPNRIIREGILSSDRVEQLDPPAEVFYRRLMSKVDDHGLYDARPSILRTSLYPLRVDRVREADIARWIAACEKAGVIALYQHDGKPYLQMMDTRWQARSEPKYPLPTANGCTQLPAPAPVFGVVGGVGVVKHPPPPPGGGFETFWSEWPNHRRKVAEDQCRKKWETKGCQAIAAKVIEGLRSAKRSDDWLKDNGEFIPAPLKWLNQAMWAGFDSVALPWYETGAGIKAKALEIGFDAWTGELDSAGHVEPHPHYLGRLKRAVEQREAQAA